LIIQDQVDPFSTVEKFDVVEQIIIHFVKVTIRPAIDVFLLQLRKETLGTRVIAGTATS
jgi:hypothetical protein